MEERSIEITPQKKSTLLIPLERWTGITTVPREGLQIPRGIRVFTPTVL
jgi:hypothetical protein